MNKVILGVGILAIGVGSYFYLSSTEEARIVKPKIVEKVDVNKVEFEEELDDPNAVSISRSNVTGVSKEGVKEVTKEELTMKEEATGVDMPFSEKDLEAVRFD